MKKPPSYRRFAPVMARALRAWNHARLGRRAGEDRNGNALRFCAGRISLFRDRSGLGKQGESRSEGYLSSQRLRASVR